MDRRLPLLATILLFAACGSGPDPVPATAPTVEAPTAPSTPATAPAPTPSPLAEAATTARVLLQRGLEEGGELVDAGRDLAGAAIARSATLATVVAERTADLVSTTTAAQIARSTAVVGASAAGAVERAAGKTREALQRWSATRSPLIP